MAHAYGFSVNSNIEITTVENEIIPLKKGDFGIIKDIDYESSSMRLVVFTINKPSEARVITLPNIKNEKSLEFYAQINAVTPLLTKEDFDVATSQAQTEAEAQAATEKAIETAQKVEEEAKNEEAKKKRSKVICIATGLGLFALALWVINSKK